ncbi:ferrichrome-iron receptor [Bryobacterales bacterium F-183]|nr:ferrichrome-iron receptor [Bryobacterales bacterium F-183]
MLDYRAESSNTATKLTLPLLVTPQAVSVVTQKVIQDRQILALSEIADNTAGVRAATGYGNSATAEYNIRGFNPPFYGGNGMRDGFRDYGFLSPRDVQGVDRVEVLKGPASILYGLAEVGGMVNTVSKRPLGEHHIAIGFQGGSWSRVRPTVDLTGPLNRGRTLFYRLNYAYEDRDSFKQFVQNQSQYLAPAVTWRIRPRTTLRFLSELQRYDYTHEGGLPAAPESLRVPIRTFLGEPRYSDGLNRQARVMVDVEHAFQNGWRLRSAINGLVSHSDLSFMTYRGLQADRVKVNRNTVRTDEFTENYNWQNEAYGQFRTGAVSHNLVAGFELARWQFTYFWNQGSGPNINLLNPVYGAPLPFRIPLFAEKAWTNFAGIYLQDQIQFARKWRLMLGARGDFADQRSNEPWLRIRLDSTTAFNLAPRAALLFQPRSSSSIYFSYTSSFFPQYGASADRRSFAPERGQQVELGYKQNLYEDRLFFTAAAYHIWKQNVLTPDLNNPPFSIASGEQVSKGIELEVTGRVQRNWSIAANYAFTQAFVSRDNSILVGSRLPRVPRHAPGVLTTYQIDRGVLSGLTVGAGVYGATRRGISVLSPILLDGYTQGELFASYQRNRWRPRANLKNAGNTRWYDGSGFGISPQAPRHVVAGVDYFF